MIVKSFRVVGGYYIFMTYMYADGAHLVHGRCMQVHLNTCKQAVFYTHTHTQTGLHNFCGLWKHIMTKK